MTLEIAESLEYEGTREGINFSVIIVQWGGRLIGEFAPFNYTPRVWVDLRDPGVVEERFADDGANGLHRHGPADPRIDSRKRTGGLMEPERETLAAANRRRGAMPAFTADHLNLDGLVTAINYVAESLTNRQDTCNCRDEINRLRRIAYRLSQAYNEKDPNPLPIRLKDQADGGRPDLGCRINLAGGAVTIMPDGYGTAAMQDGHGEPIYIEVYEGRLRVLAWADINQEDPTHTIDMQGALEARRKDEPRMKAKEEIIAEIKANPERVLGLLIDLANEYETDGCQDCGTITFYFINQVRELLGWDPLQEAEEPADETLRDHSDTNWLCDQCGQEFYADADNINHHLSRDQSDPC